LEKIKILISGIGKRNTLIRLLKKEANIHNIVLIGADADNFPPARIEFENFIKISLASSSEFLPNYLSCLTGNNIDAFLTLIDYEIPLLGRINYCPESSHPTLINPNFSTALLCEDKYQFSIVAKNNDIKVLPTSLEPLSEYPFIRKDRRGSAGSGFKIYNGPQDLDGEIKSEGKFIYQPLCNGAHYCVDVYFSIYTHKMIDFCVKKVLNKSNGESFLMESMEPGKFIPFIERISNWIQLRGIVNFDIYEENGELILMEINCRIGGNYPASHAFGCNLLQHMLFEIVNKKASSIQSKPYKPGLLVSKYFEFTPAMPVKLL
jgi:carbamoyl-phosphate synthase large subunit